MSGETVTKRLHVGGITPNITTQHLKDRFASFGKVQTVDELAPDGLGQIRPFTFLTIEITPPQLRKCLNIMSGSMWRGTQLRIAEAKPLWSDRLEQERNPSKEVRELRERKRKRRQRTVDYAAGIGKEAQDMRMVTVENYTKKKFWTLDPPNHLLRPVAMRPSHPLPALPTTSVAGPSKRLPPSRARRRVINPLLWRPTHLAGQAEFGGPQGEEPLEGVWEWHEEDEADEEEDEAYIVGQWRRVVEGKVVEEQVVKAKRRRLEEEAVDELVFADDAASDTSGSDLFGRHTGEAREASPLFGDRPVASTAQDEDVAEEEASRSRSSSPFFAARPAARRADSPMREKALEVEEDSASEQEDAGSEQTEDSADMTGGEATEQLKASSPLFPVKHVPAAEEEDSADESAPADRSTASPLFESRPLPVVPPSMSAPAQRPPTAVAVPDPLKRQVLAEMSRDLSLLDSILGGANAFGGDEPVVRAPFGGFRESDDEDEDVEECQGVLRLRGGAADMDEEMSDDDEESDEESDSDSDSDSDSSESSSSSSSGSSGTDSGAEEHNAAKPKEQSSAAAQPLKSMFAASAPTSGGFSLLASLDPELELDELDVPLAPSIRPSTAEDLLPLEPLQPGSSVAGLFDPDPSIPLFFPTASSFGLGGEDGGKKGRDGYAEATQADGWKGFWRGEDETEEQMKAAWQSSKVVLTKEWKKRHREAKKHRRRRGGVDEVE